MTWIRVTTPEASTGALRELYERVKNRAGRVDNVMQAHSLRPHTMEGHIALYRAVLHHNDNTTPAWFLETLGVYTSLLNGCAYSASHHFEGLRRTLGDDARAEQIHSALAARRPEDAFTGKELALLRYAGKLTVEPKGMREADVDDARREGATDEEILEANQVVSYFNYANRLLNGLGVTTEGDVLGESPRTTSSP